MALPFDLPAISRGFAALTRDARAAAAPAAAAAARSLSELLGREVVIHARPSPGPSPGPAPGARIGIELVALPACAVLDVEPSLVVALVDLLAGGSGASPGATALTPVEAAALELLALVAHNGVTDAVPAIEEALRPRVARAGGSPEPQSPLSLDLEIVAGSVRGRARLLVPAAAVFALRGQVRPAGPAAALPIAASVRGGRAPLAADELAALGPGDVVLVDVPETPADALVLPGGARVSGRHSEGTFHVEEIRMNDRNSQLPVTIEVELARLDIPLGELARLEPGAALPLGIDRRGIVTLRVGERAIARGELVDVDGAVGVRILSLEGTP